MTDNATATTNATSETDASSIATAVVNAEVTPARSDKVDNDYLERFERLARRERDIQAQKSRFKEVETKAEKLARLEKLVTDDPEAALAELGLTYSKLTERMLSKDPKDEAQRKVETLEQRLKHIENEKEESKKAEEQRKQTEIMQSAKDEVKRVIGDSDDYEFIRKMNRYDDVLDTCIEYFNATGKYLSFEDAAVEVEKVLEEEYAPLFESKKFKSKLSPTAPVVDGQSENVTDDVPTLSNVGMEATPNPSGFVTEEELQRRAIAALKGL